MVGNIDIERPIGVIQEDAILYDRVNQYVGEAREIHRMRGVIANGGASSCRRAEPISDFFPVV